jgi:hypothetical protein
VSMYATFREKNMKNYDGPYYRTKQMEVGDA